MPVKISPEAFVKKDYRNSNLAYKKKCVECGCVYYAKHDRSLYCSRQCNNLYSRRKRNGVMGSIMAQGGIDTKALTTDDKKTGIKLIGSKVESSNSAQENIATKALTTGDEKTPVKLSRIGQIDIDICKERGIDLADWAEEKERLAQIRNNRGGSGFC